MEKKRKKMIAKETLKNNIVWTQFCVFAQRSSCPDTAKNCTPLAHLSILDAKKIQKFLNLFAIFLGFTVHHV